MPMEKQNLKTLDRRSLALSFKEGNLGRARNFTIIEEWYTTLRTVVLPCYVGSPVKRGTVALEKGEEGWTEGNMRTCARHKKGRLTWSW